MSGQLWPAHKINLPFCCNVSQRIVELGQLKGEPASSDVDRAYIYIQQYMYIVACIIKKKTCTEWISSGVKQRWKQKCVFRLRYDYIHETIQNYLQHCKLPMLWSVLIFLPSLNTVQVSSVFSKIDELTVHNNEDFYSLINQCIFKKNTIWNQLKPKIMSATQNTRASSHSSPPPPPPPPKKKKKKKLKNKHKNKNALISRSNVLDLDHPN